MKHNLHAVVRQFPTPIKVFPRSRPRLCSIITKARSQLPSRDIATWTDTIQNKFRARKSLKYVRYLDAIQNKHCMTFFLKQRGHQSWTLLGTLETIYNKHWEVKIHPTFSWLALATSLWWCVVTNLNYMDHSSIHENKRSKDRENEPSLIGDKKKKPRIPFEEDFEKFCS